MKTIKVLSVAGAMVAIIAMASFPLAQASYYYGHEGCTPGFYKNNWKKNGGDQYPMGIDGDTPLASIFDQDGSDGLNLAGLTVYDALQFKGGPDLADKESILLRAATAAYLNAKNPDVNYVIGPDLVVAVVNNALQSDNVDLILNLASMLDNDNNGIDGCPLDNSGKHNYM